MGKLFPEPRLLKKWMGTVLLNYILPMELTFEETYFSYFLKFSFGEGMNTRKDSTFSINVKIQHDWLKKKQSTI